MDSFVDGVINSGKKSIDIGGKKYDLTKDDDVKLFRNDMKEFIIIEIS